MKQNKYYQITTGERIATINVYGYITSCSLCESEVSAYDIKKEIDELDVDKIDVYINSYGGEVAEAVAIYSALKRSRAKVTTYVDGFACSAATIIFCAGDTRIMGGLALLMVHNCMSYLGYANSQEMRKAAEDNDKINQSSFNAYKLVSNLSEEKIKQLMDNETWLTAQESKEYGFATEIADENTNSGAAIQSVQESIRKKLLSNDSDEQKSFEILMDIQKQVGTLMEKINTFQVNEENPPIEENPMLKFFKCIS